MTAAAIPSAIAPRVGSLLRLLGSDQDGEVVGAARALRRTLGGVGLDLHALAEVVEQPHLISPPARPRRARKPRSGADLVALSPGRAREIANALDRATGGSRLTSWEIEFAESVVRTLRGSRPRLSARQFEIVERLLSKIGEAGSWA